MNGHNHPINDSTIGHSSSRRPNEDEKERIAKLGPKGVKPTHIMSILKDEGGNENISLTDINNHLYKSRQDFLKGRTIMEAFIDSLTTDLWISDVWIQNNVTVGVFFANRNSVRLIQRFHTVFEGN